MVIGLYITSIKYYSFLVSSFGMVLASKSIWIWDTYFFPMVNGPYILDKKRTFLISIYLQLGLG
jgi:hypothetical protein